MTSSNEARFAGSHVAVSGASGGIGRATCAWLIAQGASVYALDLNSSSEAPGTFVQCDVSNPASVAEAVRKILAVAGAVDGFVSAAGIVEDDVAAEEMDAETFDRVLSVNLRGVFLTCQAFGRAMLERGKGSIVNVASMSGAHIVNSPQRQAAYNTAKAGVVGLTKSLAVEWGARGVRVNAVSPGYVDTPLLAGKPQMHEQWKDQTVLRRFATPDEIANAIGYLLSDDAAFCCGTELLIDGGYSLR